VGERAGVGAAEGDLALVGTRVKIPAGKRIGPGARVEPDQS
jgi:hypothetical protein